MFAIAASACTGGAIAQVFTITPSLRGEIIWTDNVNLTETNRQSDTLFVLSPGVTLTANGRHVRGSLTYSIDASRSLNNPERNQVSHHLDLGADGAYRITWIEDLLFTDITANAGLTPVLPFGRGVPSGGIDSSNVAQTWGMSVSTYAQRRLGGDGGWNARHTYTTSGSDFECIAGGECLGGGYSNTVALGADRRLGGSKFFAGINYSWSETNNKDTFDYSTQHVRGTLTYAATSAASVYAFVGYDRTDGIVIIHDGVQSGDGVAYGVGGSWTPQPRISMNGEIGQTWFGTTYNATLQYRGPRWSVTGYANRGLQSNLSEFGLPVNTDLMNFLDFSLQGRIEDSRERQRAIDEFMARRGLTRTLDQPQSITTDRPYLQTTFGIRGGLFGQHSSVFAGYGRTQKDLAQSGDPVLDAFFPPSRFVDDYASIGWSYVPGQYTAFTTTLTWTDSLEELTGSRSRGTIFSSIATRQFGRSASGSLEYRRRDYNGSGLGATYVENAVIATAVYLFR